MGIMADYDLYMLCDEDDLAPCQSIAESTDGPCNTVQSGSTVLSSAQPHDISSKEIPAAADITRQPAPLANASTVTVLSNASQPNLAAGGTPGQTIYITTQTNPAKPLANPAGAPVSYILNGQPITFLTTSQAQQLLGPRVVTTGSSAQPASSGNISRLQIPVTLTISNPSNLQSITSMAPGMTTLNMTPSSLQPTTGSKLKVITFKKFNIGTVASGGQIVNPPVQPTKAITLPKNTTITAPALLPSGAQTGKRQAQIPAPRTVTAAVFKKGCNLPAVCVRCKYRYQKSESLRGYFCQCNQELIGSVWQLKSKTIKRKCQSDKTCSKPSTLETPVSFSKSSESALKHVTASEVPVGSPSQGSGDVDIQGRLIMLVEDFFYGQRPGQNVHVETKRETVIMKCQLCDKRLMGNIKLMNHMRHHIEMEYLSGEMDSHTTCHHCYRHFSSPFHLQCHVETVHSQVESSKVCKICEWSFDNEPLFLNHMKHVHKPGEMPYMCPVCEFRSSFFQDVMSHFAEQHKDTCILMCLYCLKVFKSCTGYQAHCLKHQKKKVLRCNKCRLQFLFAKDKIEHKHRFHRTCVKPKQLQGLKPGTRVIIRAYATNQDSDSSDMSMNNHSGAAQMDTSTSSESKTFPDTSLTTPVPQNLTSSVVPIKKKPVENMMELMVKFEKQYNQTEKQFCIECSYEIPCFSNHFPTYVRCSLCRYCTCCSRAYADHMISVHVSRKSTKKYVTLYKSCPKRGCLSCIDCKYKTQIGDMMARHLTEFPTHHASRCSLRGGFSHGFKRFVFIPTDLLTGGQRLNNRTILPLQVKQVDKISFPFSSKRHPRPSYIITLPAGPAHTPSLPIQVQPIKPVLVPDQNCVSKQDASNPILNGGFSERQQISLRPTAEKSHTIHQLKVMLYALCSGVPQAANHFQTQPEEIQSSLMKRKHQLQPLRNREMLTLPVADRLVEWVLCQREQQLPIDEANLLNKASEFRSGVNGPIISYDWVVDFLLRHDLGLHAFATSRRLLPLKSRELVRSFSSFLNQQISSQNFPLSDIGAMDELSIFIDMERLDGTLADSSSIMSAFTLMSTSAPLIDVVFTALADGTILSTMLFLRGEPLSPEAPSLPDSIILEARPEGFTDEERLELWLNKVWRPHVNPSCEGKGLLIMDTYKGHIADDFLAALNSANTMPCAIPHGTSRRLQPLEACMSPVLREFLQACWSQHVTSAQQELVQAKPADLARVFSCWLIEILDVLRAEPKLLFRSFDQVLSTNPESTSEEPSELVRALTEALFASKLKDEVKQLSTTQQGASPGVVSPRSLPSPSAGILALKKIFEKDSDVESFHGFDDTELIDH